jgi:hypothetical protein
VAATELIMPIVGPLSNPLYRQSLDGNRIAAVQAAHDFQLPLMDLFVIESQSGGRLREPGQKEHEQVLMPSHYLKPRLTQFHSS